MNKFDALYETVLESVDLSNELNAVFDEKDLRGKQLKLLVLLKALKKPTKQNLAEIELLKKIEDREINNDERVAPMFRHLFNIRDLDKYAMNVVFKGQKMGAI